MRSRLSARIFETTCVAALAARQNEHNDEMESSCSCIVDLRPTFATCAPCYAGLANCLESKLLGLVGLCEHRSAKHFAALGFQ